MQQSRKSVSSTLRWVLVCVLGSGAAGSGAEEYLLDAGDEIQIQVYQEADLTMKVRLDRSGVITYPYLGQIEVRGKSAAQVQAEIDAGLRGDVLVEPSVSVSITAYRNFYIGGEIRR
ncbi:MAG: polysaccharide biosynthesis/export family protein, partial [Pseudomonadales bacterium]|nr:polysaccharide biosynthesis/export family protein [Pseudomonadales bacterium]